MAEGLAKGRAMTRSKTAPSDLVRGLIGLALIALLAGCSGVEEPWVANPEQLEQERQRSPEVAEALRHRADLIQGRR